MPHDPILGSTSSATRLPGHERAFRVCGLVGSSCRQVCPACSRPQRLSQPAAGVSIVIPSFARPHNLYPLLPSLLRHRVMHHEASEIIVSHASLRSWKEHAQLDQSTAAACRPASGTAGQPSALACANAESVGLCGTCAELPWRIRHLDHVSQNRKLLTALRFVAAGEARNGAIVHLDDDLVPMPLLLDKLVGRAIGAASRGAMALFGAKRRGCDASGYAMLSRRGHNATLVLTNLASTTTKTNAAFLRVLHRHFLPLLQATVGNGEDLVYANFVRASAGSRAIRQVRGVINANDQGGHLKNAYSKGHSHMHLRGATCACLATSSTGSSLAECVRGRVPLPTVAAERPTEPPPDSIYSARS